MLVASGKAYPEIESFREVKWPEEWPFADPRYFVRSDENPDDEFYAQARYVTHIDDGAITAITDYYAHVMLEGADVCDLCSSWISHLPPDLKLGRVAGLGMNKDELERNSRLTEFIVQDLNQTPKLPYEDESFDFVCNVVSVDYLNKPMEIFKEMYRVLKPGGRAIMSFSNRCFPTKAVAIWGQTDDSGQYATHPSARLPGCCGQPPRPYAPARDRSIWIVGSYFKYSGEWSDIKAHDISTGRGDPMFIVEGTK